MSLYIFGLSNELKDCGPEARYLLEAMVLLAQERGAGEAAISTKLLAKQLCLAEKLVKGALAELKSAQLVAVHKASSGRRGRPSIRYELASSVLSALPKREGAYGVHAVLLTRLFSAGDFAMGEAPKLPDKETRVQKNGRGAPSGAAGYVSVCNRLLLATLLAHSDQFGVMENTGRAELCRLTGLDERSLKHRLRRLKDFKLILAFLPGLSSSVFPGARVSSVYFLNLTHRIFGGGTGTVRCLHFNPDVSSPTHKQTLRPDLDGASGERTHPLRRFLKRDAVFDVLRHMVLRHAAHILSFHREELSSRAPGGSRQLREKIAADFQRPAGWTVGAMSFDRDWEQVVDHFYQLAFQVARDFRRVVDMDYRFDEVRLVPTDGRSQLILLLNPTEITSGTGG